MTATDDRTDQTGKDAVEEDEGRLALRSSSPGRPPALLSDGRPMPTDYTISLFALGGTDRSLLHPPTQRRQPMRGFEEQYVDIVDYIVRITHRIWEEKDIGYIYDVYRHNARIHHDDGL